MDNFFIAEHFDWTPKRLSYFDIVVQSLMRRLHLKYRPRTAHSLDMFATRVLGRALPTTYSGEMTNIEQRMNMYHLVSQVLAYGVEGDLVELGCNQGHSSVMITKILAMNNSTKTLSIYDSFEGLPALDARDGREFAEGQLATTDDVVRLNFRRHGLPLPGIHKGWFEDTLPDGLPEKICFAYLDGDLYESIRTSLKYVYPKMSRGAVCLIDDYCDPAINPTGWNKLPGVKQACDEFFEDKPERVEFIYSGSYSHGFFRKG